MKRKVSFVLYILLAFTLGVVTCFSIYGLYSRDVGILSDSAILLEMADNPNPQQLFIDMRAREDYEDGHIYNFINIPSETGLEVDEYLTRENLQNKYIYLFCYSGNRSAKAFARLSNNKYKHLVYITFGYNDLASLQADFVPKRGPCDCLADD